MPAYSEAVKSGLYEKQSGLVGKYDNVRRYWEDEITKGSCLTHDGKIVSERTRALVESEAGSVSE